MIKRTTVFATTSFVGFHRWAGAPAERSYLRDRHRHLFGVRVEVRVDGDDRQVEFHDLLDELREVLVSLFDGYEPGGSSEMGTLSCEQIAHAVLNRMRASHPDISVRVDEDGECGSEVRLTTD